MVENPPVDTGDVRDTGSVSESGRSSGEENGNSSILTWRIPWIEEAGWL